MQKIRITKNEQGRRLDKFLRKYFSAAPLTMIYKMIRKDVKVNGKREDGSFQLSEGDVISVYLPDDKFREFKTVRRRGKAKKQFAVIYEDDSVLIVNKPRGLLTHGDSTEKKNHLANQVLSYLIEEGAYDPSGDSVYSPAPVNRLDRNTSGLVIFCKNYDAQRTLAAAIKNRTSVGKYYLALVKGVIREPMELRDEMVRDEVSNRTIIINSTLQNEARKGSSEKVTQHNFPKEGNSFNSGSKGSANKLDQQNPKVKSMVTKVKPLKIGKIKGLSSNQVFTLIEIELMTGRTHQIRSQLAAAGHPLAGDVKYGDKNLNDKFKSDFGITTQLLHAYKLTFDGLGGQLKHLNGKTFTSDPPAEFREILNRMEKLNG